MNELERKEFYKPFFNSISLMEKEFAEMFNDPFFTDAFKIQNSRSGTMPKLNLKETDKEFIIEALVPGMGKDDLDIELFDNRLVIRGCVVQSSEDNDEKYLFREISKRDFTRVIPFSKPILIDKSSVNLDKGILTIVVSKKEDEKKLMCKKLKL